MKKINFLMLLAFVFLLFNCRTETLNDESPANSQSSKFRMTSKRISLEKSTHKEKILPELKTIETELKKSKQYTFGKIIEYTGNIFIDTENVIYIENGPNYYTYTFNIINSANVIQNLVLSPLPDGSYKKLIFTYNFTDADKINLLKGIAVDTKGKTIVTDLDSPAVSSKAGGCAYVEETIWNECSEGIHNQSNVFAWGECTAEVAPSAYTIAYWNCTSGGGGSGDGSGNPNPGGGDGTGGGSGSGGACEADAFENPTDPVNSPGPCSGGVPTQPNISTSFAWFLHYLPNNLGEVISTSQVSEFYQGFKAYYDSNLTNPQAIDFIIWGLQLKKDNPNTIWEQFQSWFLQESINASLQNELFEDWVDPTRVKPTTKFKNHAKLNGIYNKIKTASNFNQILKNFTPEGSVAHLIFDIGTLYKPEAQAETSPPKNYWINITFNVNKDWANTPKIVIVQTFMHELIHAEILRQLLAVANTNGSINEATLLDYAKNHKNIELFNAYVKAKTNDSDFQHQYMAQKYVTTIVNFLKQVYGTQYTDIEYKTVAWMSSLKGTKAWNLLPQSEKDLYINTFNTNYWLWEL